MILGMVEFIITCLNCGTVITEYYHKGYKGKRGKFHLFYPTLLADIPKVDFVNVVFVYSY